MAASVHLHEQQTMGLLNAVLESATDAVVVYDAELDALITNPGALELHGMPPPHTPFEEWGAYYEARRPGGGPLLTEELPLSRARRGERVPEMRLEIRPRLGEMRIVDVRAEPLFDADRELIGAIAVFRDVASADSAEQAARLRSAVTANMAEGVTVVRAADGQIVYVNDVVERMFGYEPGEMVGRNVSTINAPTGAAPSEIALR